MRRTFIPVAIAVLLLAGAGCAKNAGPNGIAPGQDAVSAQPEVPGTNPPTTPPPSPVVGPKQIYVTMKPKGGDTEYGSATFTAVDENHTKIVISLKNYPKGAAEDAGLYSGPCSSISAAQQYDLSAVVNGRSETTLNVDLKSFVGGTAQSVRVKTKGLSAESSLWACGDVK